MPILLVLQTLRETTSLVKNIPNRTAEDQIRELFAAVVLPARTTGTNMNTQTKPRKFDEKC
jgi:hypothetical protein